MKNKKNIKGFTLIELLVVVAIIGVLAAVGVTAFQGFTDNAKKQAMKSIHNNLVKSISAELKKCSIGNTTFMNGTSRTGATYSRPCSSNNNTMAVYARDGALNTSKIKTLGLLLIMHSILVPHMSKVELIFGLQVQQ